VAMEREISLAQSNGISRAPSLKDQVALDLEVYFAKFASKNFAIRILAKETGLNEKTIKRIFAKENKPTYQTIYKLYAIFLEESNYHSLLKKCPEVVRRYIENYSPAESES